MSIETVVKTKKPKWLKVKLPTGDAYKKVRNLVSEHKLNTICESGSCPNMGECWGAGTATFMILGNVCTRSCGFCAVATAHSAFVDRHSIDLSCTASASHSPCSVSSSSNQVREQTCSSESPSGTPA